MNSMKIVKRDIILLLLILIIGVGFRLAVYSQTTHVANSGYSSYLKSTLNYSHNNEIINAEEGNWRDSSELFKKLFSIEKREISYPGLYRQLVRSNHPPLYYYVLHTVIGWSSGKEASLQLGFLINLVASCFTIILVYFLGLNLFRKSYLALFAAFLFAVGFLTMEAYVIHKAYELQITLVMAVFLVVFRSFDKDHLGVFDYSLYGVGCTLAFLSHYYSYLYVAGICLVIFIHYAWERRDLKKLLYFGMTTCVSVIAALLIYPPAFRDLFMDFRSREIQEKLADPGSLFLGKMNIEVFLFKRWFLTTPYLLIIVTAGIVIILGMVIKRHEFSLRKLFYDKKYVYVVAYFVISYVFMIYISPFSDLRYIAPLLPLFILVLVGAVQFSPAQFQRAGICFFALFIFFFNSYCLTKVVRGEVSGGHLIKAWRTWNVLEKTTGDSSIVVVSSRPREKIKSILFHAPPRQISFCSNRIPEKLFSKRGEILVFIDKSLLADLRQEAIEMLSAHGFERFSRYPGFSVFRRKALPYKVESS